VHSLTEVLFFTGCLLWGLLPIGWLIVRIVGYGRRFRGEYSINRLRQSVLDLGFEGFLMLGIGALLKGFVPVSLAGLKETGDSFLLAGALVTSLGAAFSYCGRNRDGTLILTCFGSLMLTVPDVVQICAALWISLIVIFRKFGISGLLASLSLPLAFLFLGYSTPYIVYGMLFGLVLALFYFKEINIFNFGNLKAIEANILLTNQCNYLRR